MPIPRYNLIGPGTPVSIVLKADQRTGRQVQGTVADLLTRGDHPHGVKVRLSDGRVGRVQQLINQPANGRPIQTQAQQYTYTMSQGQQRQEYSAPAGPPPQHQQRRAQPTGNDAALPQGRDRSEQLETMQSYEAAVPETEDDVNQAALEKEFPDIDSSLIAALYGDSKNVGETRELLQELSRAD